MWENEENLTPEEEGKNECLQCRDKCSGNFCSKFCQKEYKIDMETD